MANFRALTIGGAGAAGQLGQISSSNYLLVGSGIDIDSLTGGILTVGDSATHNATSIVIGGAASSITGSAPGSAALTLGKTATLTEVLGDFRVDGAETVVGITTLNNTLQLGANVSISYTAGTGGFDASLGTGAFLTSTGNVTIGGGTNRINVGSAAGAQIINIGNDATTGIKTITIGANGANPSLVYINGAATFGGTGLALTVTNNAQISGNAKIAGIQIGPGNSIDTLAAGTLVLGAATATGVTIGGAGSTANVTVGRGSGTVFIDSSAAGATAISIGTTDGARITIGKTGLAETANGDWTFNNNVTVSGTLTATIASNNNVTVAFDSSALGSFVAGQFGAENTGVDYTLVKTDATAMATSQLVGAVKTVGVIGTGQTYYGGVVPAAFFTATSAPTRNAPAYLALSTEVAPTGATAAGSLTATAPSAVGQVVALVGYVVGNITPLASGWTADVMLRPSAPIQL
jgi:hypothetical protein